MAINTYSELQSAVGDWLNRTDLTAVIPSFVALTETNLNRTLRVRDMITRATLTWNEAVCPLPADFLELYSLEQTFPPDSSTVPPLRYVGVEELKQIKSTLTPGLTRWYTIWGNYIELFPAPNGLNESATTNYAMTLTYYASIPSLSGSQATNWLLQKSPDAYLYGALLQASPYLKNDERLQIWDAAYQRAINALQTDSERAMRPTTYLVGKKRNFGK